MADNKRIDHATGTSTVGHEWDGIEELDTPMPRWWLYIFYACIVFAIGYCIAYPAWPLLTRGTPGVLGWTSKGQLEAELAADQKAKATTLAAIDRLPVEQIEKNPTLMHAAIDGGRAAFRINCSGVPRIGRCGQQGLSQSERRRLAVGRRHQVDPADLARRRTVPGRRRYPHVADAGIRQG